MKIIAALHSHATQVPGHVTLYIGSTLHEIVLIEYLNLMSQQNMFMHV